MMVTHPISGPQVVELIIPQKTCGPYFFGLESTNAQGGRLTDAIWLYHASGWFTAHLHRKTTGRARQPSDRGTHGAGKRGKPWQRAASRCCATGNVQVQRAHILTAPADFKRLISYPKRERTEGSQEPEGMPVCLLGALRSQLNTTNGNGKGAR